MKIRTAACLLIFSFFFASCAARKNKSRALSNVKPAQNSLTDESQPKVDIIPEIKVISIPVDNNTIQMMDIENSNPLLWTEYALCPSVPDENENCKKWTSIRFQEILFAEEDGPTTLWARFCQKDHSCGSWAKQDIVYGPINDPKLRSLLKENIIVNDGFFQIAKEIKAISKEYIDDIGGNVDLTSNPSQDDEASQNIKNISESELASIISSPMYQVIMENMEEKIKAQMQQSSKDSQQEVNQYYLASGVALLLIGSPVFLLSTGVFIAHFRAKDAVDGLITSLAAGLLETVDTKAGNNFRAKALAMLDKMDILRDMMKGLQDQSDGLFVNLEENRIKYLMKILDKFLDSKKKIKSTITSKLSEAALTPEDQQKSLTIRAQDYAKKIFDDLEASVTKTMEESLIFGKKADKISDEDIEKMKEVIVSAYEREIKKRQPSSPSRSSSPSSSSTPTTSSSSSQEGSSSYPSRTYKQLQADQRNMNFSDITATIEQFYKEKEEVENLNKKTKPFMNLDPSNEVDARIIDGFSGDRSAMTFNEQIAFLELRRAELLKEDLETSPLPSASSSTSSTDETSISQEERITHARVLNKIDQMISEAESSFARVSRLPLRDELHQRYQRFVEFSVRDRFDRLDRTYKTFHKAEERNPLKKVLLIGLRRIERNNKEILKEEDKTFLKAEEEEMRRNKTDEEKIKETIQRMKERRIKNNIEQLEEFIRGSSFTTTARSTSQSSDSITDINLFNDFFSKHKNDLFQEGLIGMGLKTSIDLESILESIDSKATITLWSKMLANTENGNPNEIIDQITRHSVENNQNRFLSNTNSNKSAQIEAMRYFYVQAYTDKLINQIQTLIGYQRLDPRALDASLLQQEDIGMKMLSHAVGGLFSPFNLVKDVASTIVDKGKEKAAQGIGDPIENFRYRLVEHFYNSDGDFTIAAKAEKFIKSILDSQLQLIRGQAKDTITSVSNHVLKQSKELIKQLEDEFIEKLGFLDEKSKEALAYAEALVNQALEVARKNDEELLAPIRRQVIGAFDTVEGTVASQSDNLKEINQKVFGHIKVISGFSALFSLGAVVGGGILLKESVTAHSSKIADKQELALTSKTNPKATMLDKLAKTSLKMKDLTKRQKIVHYKLMNSLIK